MIFCYMSHRALWPQLGTLLMSKGHLTRPARDFVSSEPAFDTVISNTTGVWSVLLPQRRKSVEDALFSLIFFGSKCS